MNPEERIERIVSHVGRALLDRGAGYSVGKLVTELEGDGTEQESDPYDVWDEHFFSDLLTIQGWPDEPRDPHEVNELIDAFEEYWKTKPELRFCQIVCNAHSLENGLDEWDPNGTPYKEPLDELSDQQLLRYLERRLNE